MAVKRKAQEAFGSPKGPLSAFAAAKLARSGLSSLPLAPESEPVQGENDLAAAVATEPYDVHNSETSRPSADFLEDEDVLPPQGSTDQTQFSSFRPNNENVIQDNDDFREFVLQHDETVTFIGEYDLIVIAGIVTVYGAVIRANSNPQRVYAPATHSLPQIQARQQKTVVRISSVNTGLRKLEKLSPLFRNIWATNNAQERSFAFLGLGGDDGLRRSLSVLDIDRDMDASLRTISGKSVVEPQKPHILAVGAKSSGKSTFNRTLCNHFQSWTSEQKILYLDLDPGQPEFTPPGQISLVEVSAPLLGPPFTHYASFQSNTFRLARSHTIAATTFKEDAESYKAAVVDLLRHADKRHPMIVNYCGWVSGLGANMLCDLVPLLEISDIVLLEPLDSNLLETLRANSSGSTIHRISRRVPRPSLRTPAENRAMQTIAYFHHRLDANGATTKWSGKPVSKTRPWFVSYAGRVPGISAVISYGHSPDQEFVAEVLDGSIVAIVVLDDGTSICPGIVDEGVIASQDVVDHVDRTTESIPCIRPDAQGINRVLDPRTSHYVGLALVRSIDTSIKNFHLATPLLGSQIAELIGKKVVLVSGGFDPPAWAYLEELYRGNDTTVAPEDHPRPWVSIKGRIGIESAVWRLRHPPMASAVASAQ